MAYTPFCILGDKKEESASGKVGSLDLQPFEGFTLAPLGCPVYSGDSLYDETLIHVFSSNLHRNRV